MTGSRHVWPLAAGKVADFASRGWLFAVLGSEVSDRIRRSALSGKGAAPVARRGRVSGLEVDYDRS